MKKLFVDLEKCDQCKECVVECSYMYHPQNNGITSIRELAVFALLCRRCEEAPCVASCYHNALAKDDAGILQRGRFLCTSCKTCSIACPFGVIIPDMLTFLDSKCDFCIGRKEALCIGSCPYKAIEMRDVERDDIDKGIFVVSKNLAVHYTKWFSDDSVLYKKR